MTLPVEPLYTAIPVWQAAVLGGVQGVGEFLPISSSAHLILTPWFLGWKDPGLTFDVALHLGTLIAVLLFYGKDWLGLLGAAFRPAAEPVKNRLFWQLIVATIPGGLIGVALEKKAEHAFRHPLLIAGWLAVMAVVLLWADRRGRKSRDTSSLSMVEALLIGLAQGCAVIPGVSRAGATMTVALLLGLRREESARFSFLLSTPIIAGAAILKLRHMLHEPPHADLVTGTLVAALVGVLSIGFLVGYLRRGSFAPFAIYRVLLAGAIVAWFFMGHPAIS